MFLKKILRKLTINEELKEEIYSIIHRLKIQKSLWYYNSAIMYTAEKLCYIAFNKDEFKIVYRGDNKLYKLYDSKIKQINPVYYKSDDQGLYYLRNGYMR